MSIANVVKEVTLVGEQIFDHSAVIRNEIEKFVDRFEKNERHREFDGILRASHALVEASETPVEALFDMGKMEKMTQEVDELTERITKLSNPQYKEEHDKYLENVQNEQKKYVDACREQAMIKMRNMVSNR
ncbi:unnamed protein product [Caenorhabditis angaria]|uniref:Biogenesis of lysosome-related organelles complex 1 subunit 5 n=1 Tax=Caenorhabditis angaria TaxID=860376 RepID=A0A9P1N5T6_9PELO|nr:unnamed protein product [Caenorhabditis angaria]